MLEAPAAKKANVAAAASFGASKQHGVTRERRGEGEGRARGEGRGGLLGDGAEFAMRLRGGARKASMGICRVISFAICGQCHVVPSGPRAHSLMCAGDKTGFLLSAPQTPQRAGACAVPPKPALCASARRDADGISVPLLHLHPLPQETISWCRSRPWSRRRRPRTSISTFRRTGRRRARH